MSEWNKRVMTPIQQMGNEGQMFEACINRQDIFKYAWRLLGIDPAPTEIKWWTEPMSGDFIFCWR